MNSLSMELSLDGCELSSVLPNIIHKHRDCGRFGDLACPLEMILQHFKKTISRSVQNDSPRQATSEILLSVI
jgi:hypothetical protein